MENLFLKYHKVWAVDFEFISKGGENPVPVCLVAYELLSGQQLRIWQDDLCKMTVPPYEIDDQSLFVAYYTSAELGCHLSLGWPLPTNVLDLFCEFRNHTNGIRIPSGRGLVGALAYFGLPSIQAGEKDQMRDLILGGGPWSLPEQKAIIDYCESDVIALQNLLPEMIHYVQLEHALLRGRYMKAAAKIEFNGIPIDTAVFEKLLDNWEIIQDELIENVDVDFGVYDGRTFKMDRFSEFLSRESIPWPRLESGTLDLKDDTFKDMALVYPRIAPLRELRISLSQMRLAKLSVGSDGRNRCLLSALGSKTGRNQPSNTKFIFGPAVWLRGLIKPEPSFGMAYIDWSQQEFGIGAALSGDQNMIRAYECGDPYLEFAKLVGAVPEDATKESHGTERNLYKSCVLAVQYGMGPVSLARRIHIPEAYAKDLLDRHKRTFKTYWNWSDGVIDHAMLHGKLWTVFDWRLQIDDHPNPRSIRNFPMQANGSEMLRLACCFTTERDIRVCAPVHDAILIEAPLERLEATITIAQDAMSEASEIVLNGFRLRTDVAVFRYPNRYMDERGKNMWASIIKILEQIGSRGIPKDIGN